MTFTSRIKHIISKASKVFNFLMQNLHKCLRSPKATAHITLVRPILEYMAAQYGIHTSTTKSSYSIDRIQCRAAHWSSCNFDRYSSVTLMQHQLNLQNFQCQKNCRNIVTIQSSLRSYCTSGTILLYSKPF